MALLKHELWKDTAEGEYTFCLAGPMGDQARNLLGKEAKLIWTIEANSHVEAMTAYHDYRGWEPYTTDQEWDVQPYSDEWERLQAV